MYHRWYQGKQIVKNPTKSILFVAAAARTHASSLFTISFHFMFSKRAEPPPGETLPLPLETAARLVHRCCQAGSRNSPGRGPSVCWLRASESRSPGRDPTGSGRKRPHPAGSPRSPPVPCRCTLWSRLASEHLRHVFWSGQAPWQGH